MAVIVKISGDASQYQRDLNDVKNQTITVFGQMQNGAKNFGTEINKAGIATRFLSASMGQNVVALVRAFQVFAAGKFAIIFAAVTAAIVGLKKAWDELTLSAEEYQLKLDKTIESEQKKLDKMRESQSEEDALMKRLKDLQEREEKTREEQEEAARITQILTDRYSNLGLEVNKATGEFEDLETAMKRINEAQNEARLEQLANVIGLELNKSDALMKRRFRGDWWTRTGDTIVSMFGGEDKGRATGKSYSQLTTEQKLSLVQSLFANDANTEEEIRFLSEQEAALTRILELEKQMDNLKKRGAETTKEETDAARQRSEESRNAKNAQKAEEEAAAQAREREYEAWQKQQQAEAEAEQKRFQEQQRQFDAAQARRQSMADSLRFDAMRSVGLGEQAAVEEALIAEMRARGVNGLSGEDTMNITDMVKARFQLNSLMSASTAPMDYAPRVNSLIARGGSASPVKMPSVEDLQKRSLNQLEEIQKLVRYINNHIDDWGKVTAV